jgi:dihydroorotase-like cyclic amidohydrolase
VQLILRNCRLSDRVAEGTLDIGVQDGRIVAIERTLN